MRKSLDSHVIEEVAYFANEKAEPSLNQIRPSLSDFKVEKVYPKVYCLTPKFTIDQKPGQKIPYYSFVKAILELGDFLQHEMEDIPHSIYFTFPFPKGDISISEVDEELGEVPDNTDVFENTDFRWIWTQTNLYGKEVNVGNLSPSFTITKDGFGEGSSTVG